MKNKSLFDDGKNSQNIDISAKFSFTWRWASPSGIGRHLGSPSEDIYVRKGIGQLCPILTDEETEAQRISQCSYALLFSSCQIICHWNQEYKIHQPPAGRDI